ncbi:MAG: hypothetical protein IKE69_10415, partial [Thermoguttaceae bacterium]|nr:hypothetical protein [Thermoguttaceae bacterium]
MKVRARGGAGGAESCEGLWFGSFFLTKRDFGVLWHKTKRDFVEIRRKRKCDFGEASRKQNGERPMFRRKIYDSLLEWKRESDGRTALL